MVHYQLHLLNLLSFLKQFFNSDFKIYIQKLMLKAQTHPICHKHFYSMKDLRDQLWQIDDQQIDNYQSSISFLFD
jgi:hypothetical protein